MCINGKREFSFNGRRYRVFDLSSREKAVSGKKYGLMFKPDGDDFYHIAQTAAGFEVLMFSTIKEAQRYVEGWDFMITNCFM